MTSKPTNAKLAMRIANFIFRLLLNTLFYLAVIFLIVSASKKIYDFTYQIFGQETVDEAPGTTVDIQIKKGESTMNVASKLKLNKIIKNEYSFYIKAKLLKHTIMPGTYELNTSMTYDEIFDIITVPSDDESTE